MVVALTSVSLVQIIQLLQWRVRPAWARQLQRPQDTKQTLQSALFARNKQRNSLWRSQLPTRRFWNSQDRAKMVMDTILKSADALENWQVKTSNPRMHHGTEHATRTLYTQECARELKRGMKRTWLLGADPTEESPPKVAHQSVVLSLVLSMFHMKENNVSSAT